MKGCTALGIRLLKRPDNPYLYKDKPFRLLTVPSAEKMTETYLDPTQYVSEDFNVGCWPIDFMRTKLRECDVVRIENGKVVRRILLS